jgi:ubiquinone/menaquinone biosynthesis C-methylase UbiE
LDATLPPPPANILDCGGGPGRYALELTRKGYQVTLMDLSAHNLDFALEKARQANIEIANLIQGSAVDLSCFADHSFDAVLMLGPLYHLLDAEERTRALLECRRVLKPHCRLFAAFISRYSAIRDLAKTHPDWIEMAAPFLQQLLLDGKLPPRGIEPHEFIAYFVHPDEAADMLWEAGFEVNQEIGLEGLLSMIEDGVNQLSEPAFQVWADLNLQVAGDPSTWGGVEHLLVVATKPAWRDVLTEIAIQLQKAELDFNVAGGASVALQGVRIPVKDLDLEMSGEAALWFHQLYKDTVVEPVAYKEDVHYRSHFGKFDIRGVCVEVSGDIQRRERGVWKPTRALTRKIIQLNDVSIPVSWLEEEFLAYVRRGRIERAAQCLLKCDQEKLLALLQGRHPVGVL